MSFTGWGYVSSTTDTRASDTFFCHRSLHDTKVGLICAPSRSMVHRTDTQRLVRQDFLLSGFSSQAIAVAAPGVPALQVTAMHLQVRMAAPVPNSCLLASRTCLHLLPGDFSSSLHLLLGLQSPYFFTSTLPFSFWDLLCRIR